MVNMIQSIPAYKPLPQTQTPKQAHAAMNSVSNPFPQIEKYEYLPARPLSPARTQPKGVRPQAERGHLVKENIFQSMGSTVKSYRDYVKYFYNAAFKGEGTDYSVGKINDLAIRTGSLGIAAVLATSKLFPFAKGMEFIGLGTWFASMALWPQILGAPIKAKTGVDINQKYIDSYGRRKFVYEDNLYRPMDLYRHVDLNGKPLSEEEYYKKYDQDYVYLDKIGDKLGIPRDIKNRHEAIMNKMGQVAVQGKTLWMLTAGVMTPVVSSLAADALQEPLKNGLEKFRYNKQSKELAQMDKVLDVLLNTSEPDLGRRRVVTDLEQVVKQLNVNIPEEASKEFNSLMGSGRLSKEEFAKLQEFLDMRFFGTGYKNSMDKVMKYDINLSEPYVTLNDQLRDGLKETTSKAVKEVLSGLRKEVVDSLPNELKNYTGISQQEYWDIIKKSHNDGATEMNQLAHSTFENLTKRVSVNRFKQLGVDEDLVQMIQESIDKKVSAYMESQRHYNIPKDKMTKLFRFIETNNQLRKKLAKFEQTSIMNISESITANNWNKLPQKYLEALGFTKGELANLATVDSSKASKVLSQKLEQIVQDPVKYEKVLKTMSSLAKEAISKEEKAVIQLIGTVDNPGVLSKVKDLMTSVGSANFGETMREPLNRHYQNAIFDIQNKLRNTIDSFVRPITALDSFKNIDKEVLKILGDSKDVFASKIKHIDYCMFKTMSYEEAKKSLTAYIKDIILDKNDINNWTTKCEHNLPGGGTGMKSSKSMVQKIIAVVNGRLSEGTESIVGLDFAKKCDANNQIMRSRFIRLENKLSIAFSEGINYMTDFEPLKMFTEELLSGNKKYLDVLEMLIDERKSELSLKQITDLKRVRQAFRTGTEEAFGHDNIRRIISENLHFYTKNKPMAQMSGKNVTDFIVNAAENYRSRNKWSKLVYGLLIGSVALSTVAIALMGRKNYFNKDIYEKKDAPQTAAFKG